MVETITYKQKTYRIGTNTPCPLPPWFSPIFPAGWQEIDTHGQEWGRGDRGYARVYVWRKGLLVLVSCARQDDGRRWLHVSVSRKDKCLPTWEHMSLVKTLFIGECRQAIQIMPPREKHVNINPGVLHLWHCLDGDGLPDFTGGGETI